MKSLKHLLGKEQREKISDQQKNLLSHPLVQEFLALHPEIKQNEISIHMMRIYQYVKDKENCNKCKDIHQCPNDMWGHYTSLTTQNVHNQVILCDHKTPCKKLLAYQTQKKFQDNLRSLYADDSIFKKTYSINEMISVDRIRAKAVQRVVEYVEQTVKNGLQNKGLYFLGTLGTGKTFLAGYLLQSLAKEGYTGIIVYMPEFIEEIKQMIPEPNKLKQTLEMLKTTDLLVFDDLASEHLSPWIRDHILGSILNTRMNHKKPTFYTSNHRLEDVKRHLSYTDKDGEENIKGERLFSRIEPFVEVVEVRGVNKRGKM